MEGQRQYNRCEIRLYKEKKTGERSFFFVKSYIFHVVAGAENQIRRLL